MRLTLFAKCTAGFRHRPALRRAFLLSPRLSLCHAPAARRRLRALTSSASTHTRRHSPARPPPCVEPPRPHHPFAPAFAILVSSQARQQGSPAPRELICTARKLWDRAEGSAPALVASYRLPSPPHDNTSSPARPRRLSPLAPHIASRHDPCYRDRRAYPEPHRHRRAARDIAADCRDLVQHLSQTAPSFTPGCGM